MLLYKPLFKRFLQQADNGPRFNPMQIMVKQGSLKNPDSQGSPAFSASPVSYPLWKIKLPNNPPMERSLEQKRPSQLPAEKCSARTYYLHVITGWGEDESLSRAFYGHSPRNWMMALNFWLIFHCRFFGVFQHHSTDFFTALVVVGRFPGLVGIMNSSFFAGV